MLSWLESQETLVIALIVFAFCYLLAALIFVGVAVLARTPIARALQVTTPAMLTPLGVILGLVIAFLAARVWANVAMDCYHCARLFTPHHNRYRAFRPDNSRRQYGNLLDRGDLLHCPSDDQ